jgi:hypothetical protein
VDLGDWSIRNWRPLVSLTIAVCQLAGGLTRYVTDYRVLSQRSAAQMGCFMT